MKKRFLWVCFIAVAVIVMSLSGCSKTTTQTTEYDKLNELVKKEYSSVALSVETDFGDDTLSGEYTITKSGDSYTITYTFEQFSSFSDGELPEDYKTTYSGTTTTKNGQVVEQNGEAINVEVSDLTASTITFDKSYFTNTTTKDGSFAAKVSNVNGFLGRTMSCSDMAVNVSCTSSQLTEMTITYTSNSASITLKYSFTL